MNSTNTHPTPVVRAVAILAALLTLPAVVVPFVSFTDGYSPLDTVVWVFKGDGLWLFVLLGAPFFLGLPIVAVQIARLASLKIPRGWRAAGFTFAACSAALSLAFVGISMLEAVKDIGSGDLSEYLVLFLDPGILAIGAIWLWRTPRTADATLRVTVALAAAYLANASFCLIGFSDDPDLGWWLALVAFAGIALDAALVVIAGRLARSTVRNLA